MREREASSKSQAEHRGPRLEKGGQEPSSLSEVSGHFNKGKEQLLPGPRSSAVMHTQTASSRGNKWLSPASVPVLSGLCTLAVMEPAGLVLHGSRARVSKLHVLSLEGAQCNFIPLFWVRRRLRGGGTYSRTHRESVPELEGCLWTRAGHHRLGKR